MPNSKVQDRISQLFITIFRDPINRVQFQNIRDNDPYIKANKQEDFIIERSNGIFYRLDPYYKQVYDSKLDLDYGDFKDRIFGNYYDLKVGNNKDNLAGSITYKSIKYFGDSFDNKHWYVCTTPLLDKLYIINARELYLKALAKEPNVFNLSDEELEKPFFGEKAYGRDYKSYI